MNLYPYNIPIIMTDTIFADYGGDPEKGTSKQRKIAYRLAEITATEDLSTFLLPTIVTGTFYAPFINPIVLDYAYVTQVYKTSFLDFDGDVYWSQTGIGNDYIALRDDGYGILDISYLVSHCNCHTTVRPYPYQVQVAYQAGLPSGTSYQPDILLGLCTYADIILNEIVGYGNEGPGDVGIEQFNSQGYSEVRRIRNTTFGSSPRANFAQKRLQRVRKLRFVGL